MSFWKKLLGRAAKDAASEYLFARLAKEKQDKVERLIEIAKEIRQANKVGDKTRVTLAVTELVLLADML